MSARRRSDRGLWRRRTHFEWALLGISLIASATVAFGLILSELTEPDGPADLRATVGEPSASDGGFRILEVRVENVGGTSALDVTIEVRVDDVVGQVTIDLVARGEAERATVMIPAAASGEPVVEVVSYASP